DLVLPMRLHRQSAIDHRMGSQSSIGLYVSRGHLSFQYRSTGRELRASFSGLFHHCNAEDETEAVRRSVQLGGEEFSRTRFASPRSQRVLSQVPTSPHLCGLSSLLVPCIIFGSSVHCQRSLLGGSESGSRGK